jgi:aminoglycoside/choline kinase family phosphotransferase
LELSAPEIFASQADHGFLLLEDLGRHVYFDMAARDEDMALPMQTAVDVLVHLAEKLNKATLEAKFNDHQIPAYSSAALQIEIELLADWYWPRIKAGEIGDEDRQEFLKLWQPLWRHLEQGPRLWCLRDYHSPNLIWLPHRDGIARVGLLDYQDAVLGSPAYDLMSLLQDARRDVSADEEASLYAYYWQQIERTAVDYDRNDFDFSYAILGAQRATKILGIFSRLADRDDKPGYLKHIPRVRAYLERNLQHAGLHSLKHWFAQHLRKDI